jgi:hypothetical protein
VAIGTALLDYFEVNPFSRLPLSMHKNLDVISKLKTKLTLGAEKGHFIAGDNIEQGKVPSVYHENFSHSLGARGSRWPWFDQVLQA